MKYFKTLLLLTLFLSLTSCEVIQETKFNTDGSGQYSLGFDFSEMMKMGMQSNSNSKKRPSDTLIVFSDFINSKKDSIAKLSKEKQEKINQLKDFSLEIKADSVSKKFAMKINYNFKDTKDLKLFAEKLQNQEIDELNMFTDKLKGKKTEAGDKKKKKELPDFNKLFDTKFSKKKFSLKITPEGLAEALKNKDTTMTKDNPMVDMIRFKTRYTFPYRIKKISNENVKILSDFKGIEISANLYEVNSNPKFFDMDIEFEKK